jgi:hypothetical protein
MKDMVRFSAPKKPDANLAHFPSATERNRVIKEYGAEPIKSWFRRLRGKRSKSSKISARDWIASLRCQ